MIHHEWKPIDTAPDLERVLVCGWNPRHGNVAGYWWWHEDTVTDGSGSKHPDATHWAPLILPQEFPAAPSSEADLCCSEARRDDVTHSTPDPLRETDVPHMHPMEVMARNFRAKQRAALAAAPQTAAEDQEARAIAEAAQITMTYRNWRGEVAQRTIRPVALWFGKTDWHPEHGWLLSAWDCDKGERRDFALADCQFAALARPSQAGDERVARLESIVRPFADALDIECDFMTPPAPFEDGFDVRRRARAALAAMDTPKGGGDE